MFEYEFPRPAVAADIAAFALDNGKLKILLVRRGVEPFLGEWALPGGFVLEDETIEACAARELQEETGVEGESLIQFGIYSKPGRDPRNWVISIAYVTAVPLAQVVLKSGTDAAAAEWFSVDQLPAVLAFDHRDIIRDAIEALRNNALLLERQRRDVPVLAFRLLGETFSLSALQAAVEVIVGNERDKRNFRKQVVEHWLEPTGTVSTGRHRPALNYRLRPKDSGLPE
jgi:8-oxo-dGTP diphosphatase